MKKTSLMWAATFYAILYSASLLYIGHVYGQGSLYPYQRGPEYFLFPAVYLILLGMSVFLVREREYNTSKSYYAMGIVTLALSCLLWGRSVVILSQGGIDMEDPVDMYIYPGVVFCFSVLISVIYVACAVRTQKENRSIRQ